MKTPVKKFGKSGKSWENIYIEYILLCISAYLSHIRHVVDNKKVFDLFKIVFDLFKIVFDLFKIKTSQLCLPIPKIGIFSLT